VISKKFYINIVLRIVLILINCFSIVPFFAKEEKLFTIISLVILLFIQIILLINYINKFNKDIAYFFSALKTNDASFAFHDRAFPHIADELREDIEYVKNQIFNITQSKEIQESYLKTLIESAQTGIITFNSNGKVDVVNKHAMELLQIKQISNINSLQDIHPAFYQFIKNASAGDEKMVNITSKLKTIPLAIRVTEFKQKSNQLKLISFQNIESELNEKELLSWHKLIRVLNHEINNSIAPISSLADSLKNLFHKNHTTITKEEISEDIIEKTSEGLSLITKRSKGLIHFVHSYKEIASLKNIDCETIKVAELFYNLELLMKNQLKEKNIKLEIEIKPFDLEIYADKKYIEQICINLIKNSIEAIEANKGQIRLIAYKDEQKKTILKFQDNGNGIDQEIMNQIFVPFFTTKEKGSGIGLSLARQIIQLHGGNISVNSEPGKTIFTLVF
jgi:nitrogen fixation/metabolism regulation signal transduction histidine kinase